MPAAASPPSLPACQPESGKLPRVQPDQVSRLSSLNFVHFENLGYDVMVANGTAGLSIWSLKDPEHPKWIAQVTVPQLQTVATTGAGSAQTMVESWRART